MNEKWAKIFDFRGRLTLLLVILASTVGTFVAPRQQVSVKAHFTVNGNQVGKFQVEQMGWQMTEPEVTLEMVECKDFPVQKFLGKFVLHSVKKISVRKAFYRKTFSMGILCETRGNNEWNFIIGSCSSHKTSKKFTSNKCDHFPSQERIL